MSAPYDHARDAALIARARQQVDNSSSAATTFAPFVGGYEFQREIHRGGQGVVYLARQVATRREVAIKVLRDGPFAGPAERLRFEREVRILASLRHPHIVAVHDSGAALGCYYLVMDYIAGQPFDHWAACLRREIDRPSSSRRSLAARRHRHARLLEAFGKICEAVSAAHQRGIIHRDLKPGNIRVDPAGEPHVLDFGLAKHASTDALESAELTRTGQFVGTLPWASPEQVEGTAHDADVRSDVYALGLLLYQALTGRLPYAVDAGQHEIMQAIRHNPPAPPSTFCPHVDGDLETIVLKCLSKDPDRRYQSAGELAGDLRRFLAGEPIEARRDSRVYLLRMFARRHRAAVIVGSAFVALLGVASVSLALMYARQVELRSLSEQHAQRAIYSEGRALQREAETRRIAAFQATLLAGIDPEAMGAQLRQDLVGMLAAPSGNGEAAPAPQALSALDPHLANVNFTSLALRTLDRNIFARTAQAIDEQFAAQPLVRARLLQTQADTLAQLGLLEEALRPQQHALDIRRRELGVRHPDTLASTAAMGNLLIALGRADEGLTLCRAVFAARRETLGAEHPDTLLAMTDLGRALQETGRKCDALETYRAVLAAQRRVLPAPDPQRLATMSNLGSVLYETGRLDEARQVMAEALELAEQLGRDEDAEILVLKNNFARVLQALGRRDEALPWLESILATRRRLLGDDHPATLNSLNNLAGLLRQMGRAEEARRGYEEALAGHRGVLGREHPRTVQSLSGLGVTLGMLGRFDEAEQHLSEAVETGRRVLGWENPDTLEAVSNLGHLLHSTGRLDEARALYEEALEAFRYSLGDEHPRTLSVMNNLAALLSMRGKLEESMALRQEVLESQRRTLGPEHPSTLTSTLNLGHLLLRMNRAEEAEVCFREAHAGCSHVLGDRHATTLNALASIGGALQAQGRLAEALVYRCEALDAYRETLGDGHPDTLHVMNKTASLLIELGEWDDAEQLVHLTATGVAALPPAHALHGLLEETRTRLADHRPVATAQAAPGND